MPPEDSAPPVATLWRVFDRAVEAGDVAAAVGAHDALVAHPCAHHEVGLAETWAQLARLHADAGDPEAAEAARRAADAAATEELRRCEHCGFDPSDWSARASDRRFLTDLREALGSGEPLPEPEEPPAHRGERPAPVAFAWFPREEWAVAIEAWPDLLETSPEDHTAYSRQVEGWMKRAAKDLPGSPKAIAPLSVERLRAHAASVGKDAGSGEVRSGLAAELMRLGEAIPWPPGRNDPCWCGSGGKYKRCCGPVPAPPD